VRRGSRTRISAALVLLVFSNPVSAQSNPNPQNLRSITGASELALHDLNERGISLQGTMIYDWSKEFEPGESEAGFGRFSFDLSMPVDGKRLWGLNGSAGMIRLRHHLNNFGEDSSGEEQLYSNIDASPRTTLYEVWIEQRVFAEKLRLKFGKIDANTEFAVVQTASDFLNSSMGYSPTIIAFPTYPEPKLGFNAFYRPATNNTIGLGVFRTASAGTLTVVEPGRSWNLGHSENPGHVSGGYRHLGGSLARFDGQIASGTNGFYSVLEQTPMARS
jgi:porin